MWLLWGGVHGCSSGACMVAHGGHAWLLQGVCMVAPGGMHGCSWGVCGCSGEGVCGCSQGAGHEWLLQGCVHGCSQKGHVWDTTRYGDMINERAVRILLECILVTACQQSCGKVMFSVVSVRQLVSLSTGGESPLSKIHWFSLYTRPGHQTPPWPQPLEIRHSTPPPPPVISGGHHWRPVKTCSLKTYGYPRPPLTSGGH